MIPHAFSGFTDILPYDILIDVFRYACTDGGRTGAALARTSRTVAKEAAPFRFYSLHLTSLRQTGQLLLGHERIQLRYNVVPGHKDANLPRAKGLNLGTRHLLLSFFAGADCDIPPREGRSWDQYSRGWGKQRKEIHEDESAWRAAKAAWDRQFTFVISDLLARVAPTLQTLVVLQSCEALLPYVGGVNFPELRELTLLADDGMFIHADPEWACGSPRSSLHYSPRSESEATVVEPDDPPFPSLTHLHVVYQGGKTSSWEKNLPKWTTMAPAVTHLRISQASNVIPEMLDVPTRSFPQNRSFSPFRNTISFPCLRRAIVQPLVLEPVRGHQMLEDAEIIRSAHKSDSQNVVVVVMRGRCYRAGYWKDRLRWDWEGRMTGQTGCWSEREDDEGEWAYERRKRVEVAAAKTQQLSKARAMADRVVSLIRLDRDDGQALKSWSILKRALVGAM